MRRLAALVAVTIAAVGLVSTLGSPAGATPDTHWVASWTASPTDAAVPIDGAFQPLPAALDDQTLRMVITPHLGGATLRVHLSNRFDGLPTSFGKVTVGHFASGAVTGAVPVTFGGQSHVTIPAGQDAISDPVELTFAAFTQLAVDLYVPGVQLFPTKHWNANATSRYSAPGTGDLAGAATDAGFTQTTQSWLYVDALDVEAPTSASAIVAFGDSITDGWVAANQFSFPVSTAISDTNARYPDDLQRRVDAAGLPLSIVNAGMSSNRVVTDGEPLMIGPSALQRFAADALDQAGVTGVIVLEGINDLGIPPAVTTPAQLIAGLENLIAQAHAAGKRVWLGTITPASNAIIDGVATAPLSEVGREQVNAWIRGQHLADGVIDFDAALRDPTDPHILNPAYSGPDHLHPNLAGYQAMANAIDLAMLTS